MVAGLPRSGPGMSVQEQYGSCRTVREGVVPPPSPREEPANRAVTPERALLDGVHHDTVPAHGLEDMYEQQIATDVDHYLWTSATAGLPKLSPSRTPFASGSGKSAELRDDRLAPLARQTVTSSTTVTSRR
jgi:hypothetical protein